MVEYFFDFFSICLFFIQFSFLLFFFEEFTIYLDLIFYIQLSLLVICVDRNNLFSMMFTVGVLLRRNAERCIYDHCIFLKLEQILSSMYVSLLFLCLISYCTECQYRTQRNLNYSFHIFSLLFNFIILKKVLF